MAKTVVVVDEVEFLEACLALRNSQGYLRHLLREHGTGFQTLDEHVLACVKGANEELARAVEKLRRY